MSFLLRSIMSPSRRQLMMFQQQRGAKMRAQQLEVAPNRFVAYRQVPGEKS